MSIRTRIILLGTLVAIALLATTIAAVATYHAYERLYQQRVLIQARDVQTIRPWMTLHYIARVYHVPENYLYQTLSLSSAPSLRHATLYALAQRKHQPVQQIITSIRHASDLMGAHVRC